MILGVAAASFVIIKFSPAPLILQGGHWSTLTSGQFLVRTLVFNLVDDQLVYYSRPRPMLGLGGLQLR